MRVYLDACAIQRPSDAPSHLRIRLEAEAVLGVLAACLAGSLTLVASYVHYAEAARNPYADRRHFNLNVLSLASELVSATDAVADRAGGFAAQGLRAADALHVASAVEAHADVFCTTDDGLLKKARRSDVGPMRLVTPLELVTLMGL